MNIEIIKVKNGEWEYRFKSKGRITTHSESYNSLANAKRALSGFMKGICKLLKIEWKDKIKIIEEK